jgi:hypothetical protein
MAITFDGASRMSILLAHHQRTLRCVNTQTETAERVRVARESSGFSPTQALSDVGLDFGSSRVAKAIVVNTRSPDGYAKGAHAALRARRHHRGSSP